MSHLISPTNLVASRIELHYAAQVLAACADAWLPRRDDDGHTAMRWRSRLMIGETGLSLRCDDLTIVSATRSFSLDGRTIDEALAWADAQLGSPRGAKLRDYDLPDSALRSGTRFAATTSELGELARWYDAGNATLERAAEGETLSSPIRVWPHHFDLGAILDDGIGLGLSPGDRYYPEPYYYVTPPRSVPATLTIGGGGVWRTERWQGAVLTASALGDPDVFMSSAVEAIRSSLR